MSIFPDRSMSVKRWRGRTFFGLGGVGDDVGVGGQVTLTRTVRTEPDTTQQMTVERQRISDNVGTTIRIRQRSLHAHHPLESVAHQLGILGGSVPAEVDDLLVGTGHAQVAGARPLHVRVGRHLEPQAVLVVHLEDTPSSEISKFICMSNELSTHRCGGSWMCSSVAA